MFTKIQNTPSKNEDIEGAFNLFFPKKEFAFDLDYLSNNQIILLKNIYSHINHSSLKCDISRDELIIDVKNKFSQYKSVLSALLQGKFIGIISPEMIDSTYWVSNDSFKLT